GEVVGSLDARFANRSDPGDFSLGGTTWSVVRCDESHDLVVVVPGRTGKSTMSRIFWTAGEVAALSPVICGAVQQIVARGGTTLPLGEGETKALCEALRTLPAGIGGTGIFVREERGTGGKEVIIYSFHGSRFNRVLAHLAKGLLGRVQVGYDDERVWVVRAGKTGAAERVTGVIRKIPHLTPAEIAGYLPLPSPDLWKFAGVLPLSAFRDMVLWDYYHNGEFMQAFAREPVTLMPDAEHGAGETDPGVG